MKRYGNLFDKIFTEDSLFEAYLVARKGKRNKKACFEFEKNLTQNLSQLHNELINDIYSPRPYYQFVVFEPKRRVIKAPAFRDCVVQHAIYKTVYPIFDRTFVYESFACRKNKGTHKASKHIQNSMRKCSPEDYMVQMDIKKFFPSINTNILKVQIQRKIKDERLVRVMMMFTEHKDTGIPIGNLLSQLYANIYLNVLDHYCKRELKIKNYVRYVDDFVFTGIKSLSKSRMFLTRVVNFLNHALKVSLSKWSIFKIKRGINYIGYRTWQKTKLIRKHSLYKFFRALKKNKNDITTSILGHALPSGSHKYLLRSLQKC